MTIAAAKLHCYYTQIQFRCEIIRTKTVYCFIILWLQKHQKVPPSGRNYSILHNDACVTWNTHNNNYGRRND